MQPRQNLPKEENKKLELGLGNWVRMGSVPGGRERLLDMRQAGDTYTQAGEVLEGLHEMEREEKLHKEGHNRPQAEP